MTEEEYIDRSITKLKLMWRFGISDLNFHQTMHSLVNIILQENPQLMEEQPVYLELARSEDNDNKIILAEMLLNHDNQKQEKEII